MVRWQQELARCWSKLRFGSLTVDRDEDQHVFTVQVYLDDLDPDAVRVELYADGQNGSEPVRQSMDCGQRLRAPQKVSSTAPGFRRLVLPSPQRAKSS
jgi:starch phosphorylase